MKLLLVAIAAVLAAAVMTAAMPEDLRQHAVGVTFNTPGIRYPNSVPAIQGGFTAQGVQQVLNAVLPQVMAKIRGMTFDGESGEESGYKYQVSNIRMKELNMAASSASVSNGLQVGVSGVNVALSLDWEYKKHKFPWVPRGSGSADASLSNSAISATFQINTINTPQGLKPQVRASAVQVSLNDVDIKVHGSIFSWLYNLIIKLFKGKIKDALQNAIRAAFVAQVDAISDQILATMPTLAPVSTWGTLDFGLTQGATYYNDAQAVGLSFNGEVYPITTNATEGVPHPAMPYAPSGRMFDGNLHFYVLNSAARSWARVKGFGLVINEARHPAAFPEALLNTQGWTLFLRQLSDAFPNMPLEFRVTLGTVPHATGAAGALSLDGSFIVETLVHKGGDYIPAFTLNTAMQGGATMTLVERDGMPFFVPQITNAKLDATVLKSSIGDFNVDSVENFLNAVIKMVVIPAVNQELWAGIPLPAVAGLKLSNAIFFIKDDYINFGADVAFTPVGIAGLQ